VRVQPRASRDALAGTREGALLVRLKAPPVDGAANAALLRLLGEAVGLPRSAVEIQRGATGREKVVRLRGLDVATARQRLLARLPEAEAPPSR
jgi:uncharacterized protein